MIALYVAALLLCWTGSFISGYYHNFFGIAVFSLLSGFFAVRLGRYVRGT